MKKKKRRKPPTKSEIARDLVHAQKEIAALQLQIGSLEAACLNYEHIQKRSDETIISQQKETCQLQSYIDYLIKRRVVESKR